MISASDTDDDQHPIALHRHRQVPPKLLREQLGGHAPPGKTIVYDIIRLITWTQELARRPNGRRSVFDRLCTVSQLESGRLS